MIGQVPTGSIGRQTSQGKQRFRAASNARMLLSTTANRPVENGSYINWSMILKRFYRLCRQKKVSRPNVTQSARIELSFGVREGLSTALERTRQFPTSELWTSTIRNAEPPPGPRWLPAARVPDLPPLRRRTVRL